MNALHCKMAVGKGNNIDYERVRALILLDCKLACSFFGMMTPTSSTLRGDDLQWLSLKTLATFFASVSPLLELSLPSAAFFLAFVVLTPSVALGICTMSSCITFRGDFKGSEWLLYC